jgi:hypothetical protein
MLVYQRVSSKTIKNRDGKFSGWRKSDQLWPVHWASVELSQVSTLLQLGNRPHPPGGRQKPWRDMPRPRGRKHKHCYCCSISDAILGWKILDYSDYSYTFWSSNLTCWKKKKTSFCARLRFVLLLHLRSKQNKTKDMRPKDSCTSEFVWKFALKMAIMSRVHLWQRHLWLLQFHGRQVLSADCWIGWMGSKLTMSGDGWVYKVYTIHKNCVLGIFILGFTTLASFRAPEPAFFLRKHSTTRVVLIIHCGLTTQR